MFEIQIKKPPDVGGFNFWYSALCEYRANHADELRKMAIQINDLIKDVDVPF